MTSAPATTRRLLQLRYQVTRLFDESLAKRLSRLFHLNHVAWLDDRVEPLKLSPIGMFFYNLRALSFLIAATFAMLLHALALLPGAIHKDFEAATILSVILLVDLIVTLSMHPNLVRRLRAWSLASGGEDLPRLFDLYFFLDSALLMSLVSIGWWSQLNFDSFALLVFANLAAVAIYAAGTRRFTLTIGILPILAFFTNILLILPSGRWVSVSWRLFDVVLSFGPALLAMMVVGFSGFMLAWLRTTEHNRTQDQWGLLSTIANDLTRSLVETTGPPVPSPETRQNVRPINRALAKSLRQLCETPEAFSYDRAVVWYFERHHDRGILAVPGPDAAVDTRQYTTGVAVNLDSVPLQPVIIIPNGVPHAPSGDPLFLLPPLTNILDVPAALVPLVSPSGTNGILVLSGRNDAPFPKRHETAFLSTFGSIVADAIDQWEHSHLTLAQSDLDDLFSCKTLKEVFERAVKLLRRYLHAQGCMVLFRPDSTKAAMDIVATDGMSSAIGANRYTVGVGQTGRCAELGVVIRVDDVAAHRHIFAADLLGNVEAALGTRRSRGTLRSWMAIPIGPPHANYGVIKVMNSFSNGWFTDRDERLGRALALRLNIVIERFITLERMEAARNEAQQNAKTATTLQKNAEMLAKQLHDALMVMTHQLQGPLVSMVGAVTSAQLVKTSPLPGHLAERLDHILGLTQDAIALCYGTSITFAKEAGRKMSFHAAPINATSELKALCTRLQRTNSRNDLRFLYNEEPNFPTIVMDRNVFTSVFFSLVHNAMKYADPDSIVMLECGFERATGEAAFKVRSVGEPIEPQEVGTIFQKYRRGRLIEHTGRHHDGIGLGLWIAKELMKAVGGDIRVELATNNPRVAAFVVTVSKSA